MRFVPDKLTSQIEKLDARELLSVFETAILRNLAEIFEKESFENIVARPPLLRNSDIFYWIEIRHRHSWLNLSVSHKAEIVQAIHFH